MSTYGDVRELLTDDENAELQRATQALDVIGNMFLVGEGTAEGLRIALAQIRVGIDVLEGVVDRWEAEDA